MNGSSLRSMRLLTYRCFDDVTIELPSAGVVFVVGPNNAGKTLLTRALHMVSDYGQAREAFLEYRTSLIPRAATGGSIEFFDHLVRGIGSHIVDGQEAGQYVIVDADADLPARVDRDIHPSGRAWVKLEIQDTHGSGLKVQAAGGGGSVRPSFSRGAYDQVFGGLARPAVFSLPNQRSATVGPVAVSAEPNLGSGGSNLANALLYLKTQRPKQFSRIQDAVDAVVPGIGELRTHVGGSNVWLTFNQDDDTQRDLHDLGSGLTQLLLIATAAELQPRTSITILDEPEIGLHPDSQRRLMTELRRWSADSVLVIVTHSPYLLEERADSDVVYLVRQNDRHSTAERVDTAVLRVLEALGVNENDVFGARRALVVEGSSDREVLFKLFPGLRQAAGVAIVVAGSSTQVRGALAALRNSEHIRADSVWGLLDRDDGHPGPAERLQVLSRRELENFFLDQPNAIRQTLVERGCDAIDVEAIERKIREIADALRTETIWLRACEMIRRSMNPGTTRLHRDGTDVAPTFELLAAIMRSASEQFRGEERANQIWTTVEQEVNLAWETAWMTLVPGSLVLETLWQSFSLKYDKIKDGSAIAAELQAAGQTPPELVALINSLTEDR